MVTPFLNFNDSLFRCWKLPLEATFIVKVGDVLKFSTVIGSKQTGQAKVSLVSPVANQNSLSLRVLAALENAEGKWRAGIPLSVRMVDSAAQKVTAVSAPAIVNIEGKSHLFIEGEGGRFQPVAVSTGIHRN